MLKKVDQLASIGRFQSLQHRAEAFKRLALLFARNGYGKTTICAVLRSAISQDSRAIDERAHLGTAGIPSATLQFEPSVTVTFNGGTWNRTPPPVMIFDQEYVKANVHAAEEVTRNNKRALLQVIVGAAGVTLARRIADLDTENTALNSTIRGLETAIKAAAPIVNDVATFVNAASPADLEQRVAGATRTALKVERTAEVQRRARLATLDLGPDAPAYTALLAEDLGGLMSGAGLSIEQHRMKHKMADGRWLRFGVEHTHGDDCPFCDQNLAGSPVIGALRLVYGEEYRSLADRLDAALRTVATADSGAGSLRDVYARNADLHAFWSEIVEIPALPDLMAVPPTSGARPLEWMEAGLRLRAGNPSQVINPSLEQLTDWDQLLTSIAAYDRQVLEVNAAIETAKAEAGTLGGEQVVQAKSNRDKYLALSRRSEDPLASLCDRWREANRRHAVIATERKAAQDGLRAHAASTASNYEDSVNALLERFGCNFRLCQNKASFVGGRPNVEYCIDINGHALAVGESGSNPVPSFRTVLSAGDKASLALALFMTQVAQRTDLADLTIVFDDPFTSQDVGRQFETVARIRELATEARQVIVLSHDARFLNQIYKDADHSAVSEHQIVLNGDWSGEVRYWSSADELQTDYVRRAERIRAFASTGQHLVGCSSTELASALRVFVEEYLDLRFPGRFNSNETLGLMVTQIEQVGTADPLYAQRVILKELNEYSRPDHHRGTSPPDPTQLRVQCRKVVSIIGAY